MPYEGSDFMGITTGLLKYEQSCFSFSCAALGRKVQKFTVATLAAVTEPPLFPSLLLPHLEISQWS